MLERADALLCEALDSADPRRRDRATRFVLQRHYLACCRGLNSPSLGCARLRRRGAPSRCATAGSTSPRLGHKSFAAFSPLALLGSALYPGPVRRPAASLPASFTPASRSDALRFAS